MVIVVEKVAEVGAQHSRSSAGSGPEETRIRLGWRLLRRRW